MILPLLLLCAVTACGKKGPPLTPVVRVPAAPEVSAAQRIGGDAYVTVRIPQQNIDGSKPASVSRVEIYGATALTPPPRARVLEIATLVGVVPVLPAADPADPRAPVPVAEPGTGAVQGAAVTLRDALTLAALQPQELPLREEDRRRLEQARREQERRRPATAAVPPTPLPTALRRFYVAIAYSARGVPGPPSAMFEMPLTVLPDPPTGLSASVTETDLTLQWEPAGGLVGWVMDRALDIEQAPIQQPQVVRGTAAVPPTSLPPGATQYNVYRQMPPDPLALPDVQRTTPGTASVPAAVNPVPLAVLTYSEPLVADERERCYHVRSVRGAGTARIESDPSPAVCITPFDIYPPAAPTNLTALAGEGLITLIWEPNIETDLGGYIVLRRDAAGDTLQLTATPIADTRFTDRTVAPGIRYTYVVRAVDSRVPLPNVSEDAEVSETAR